MERVILHSDMNNFYASVECMLNPELKGQPVAVCGSAEERHGIVLAKNYAAKAYGVATGDVIWQAKQKCKDLVVVPPHYDEYIKFSKKAREIYSRYTDLIEPFGMDECWLDVTGSTGLFGSGYEMASTIKETIKFELGLTVSIGVSFNKIFAKLGSDMKKPDAITCIESSTFKEKICKLPASDLLGVGRASKKKLDSYGIRTIGDLANTDVIFLKLIMKSHGEVLWRYANGYDNSKVMASNYVSPIKSIGHGITTKRDLENENDVWPVILELTQDIGRQLRKNDLAATGVAVFVRDNELHYQEWQCKLPLSTQSQTYIARKAFDLFQKRYSWDKEIRSITIRAIDLIDSNIPVQMDLFENRESLNKQEKLEAVVDIIRERFGKDVIKNGVLCKNIEVPKIIGTKITMPTGIRTCV